MNFQVHKEVVELMAQKLMDGKPAQATMLERVQAPPSLQVDFLEWAQGDVEEEEAPVTPPGPQTLTEARLECQAEFQRFLELRRQRVKAPPLRFWHEKGGEFPHLRRIAPDFLAVQATSAESERCFSKVGAIVRARRSSLSPETV